MASREKVVHQRQRDGYYTVIGAPLSRRITRKAIICIKTNLKTKTAVIFVVNFAFATIAKVSVILTVENAKDTKGHLITPLTYGEDNVNFMSNLKKPLKTKVVPIEVRLTEKRSKIYRCLCSMDTDFEDKLVLLQELIDSYIDLVKLKMAAKNEF